MTGPAVSIVIPTFDGAARLPRTLASLTGSHVPSGFEVIVVDDGSADATAAAAGAFSGRLPLRVLTHERNRGRAAAKNTGIRAAAGRIVLLLDDDMETEPGLAARHLEAHPPGTVHAAIGRIVYEGLDPRVPFHAFLLREEHWRRERLLSQTIGFGEIWTGQLSFGRELAMRVGLFDEEIGSYGLEDIEFGYRIAQASARFVYLDDAVSHHAAYAVALDRYCERQRMVGKAAAYVARRHDTPEMRRYLRIEAGRSEGSRSRFLRLMDLSASMLRRRRVASILAGRASQILLRGSVRVLETCRLRRPLAFGYSFLRDIEYFAALGSAMTRGGAGEARR